MSRGAAEASPTCSVSLPCRLIAVATPCKHTVWSAVRLLSAGAEMSTGSHASSASSLLSALDDNTVIRKGGSVWLAGCVTLREQAGRAQTHDSETDRL